MIGFTVRSLGSLKNNTPFVLNGNDLLKVAHPTLGFAARTGDGRTVVLTGKTPVLVAQKPRPQDGARLASELADLHKQLG